MIRVIRGDCAQPHGRIHGGGDLRVAVSGALSDPGRAHMARKLGSAEAGLSPPASGSCFNKRDSRALPRRAHALALRHALLICTMMDSCASPVQPFKPGPQGPAPHSALACCLVQCALIAPYMNSSSDSHESADSPSGSRLRRSDQRGLIPGPPGPDRIHHG